MRFSAILVTVLPTMAAAVAIPNLEFPILPRDDDTAVPPNSSILCIRSHRKTCPPSTDGVQRCLNLDYEDLCVLDCGSQSVCRTQCQQQAFVNGFCTVGKYACICTDLDGGSDFSPFH